MHQEGVAPLDKDRAIACARRLVPAHPGGSGYIEIYGSRYWSVQVSGYREAASTCDPPVGQRYRGIHQGLPWEAPSA